MKTALFLLGLLLVLCLIGSFVVQGQSADYYLEIYGTAGGHLIVGLGWDHIFSMWYTGIVAACLCINLLCCNLLRARPIANAWKALALNKDKKEEAPEKEDDRDSKKAWGYVLIETLSEQEKDFFLQQKKGYHFLPEDSGEIYAFKNRIGVWGAWLTHLGMLIIIVGFAITETCSFTGYNHGIAGEAQSIEGSDLQVRIDSFKIDYNDDDSVSGYTTALSILDSSGNVLASGESSVNHPFTYKGYHFYQNSTGFACKLEMYNGEELLSKDTMYAGTSMSVAESGFTIYFDSMYPDYELVNGHPATRSPYLNNPAVLYVLYYQGQMIDMNIAVMGERLKFREFELAFEDAEYYTMLQVKKDPALGVVLAGACIIMFGLFFSFYMRPEQIRLIREADKWSLYGKTTKSPLLMQERIKGNIAELRKET